MMSKGFLEVKSKELVHILHIYACIKSSDAKKYHKLGQILLIVMHITDCLRKKVTYSMLCKYLRQLYKS